MANPEMLNKSLFGEYDALGIKDESEVLKWGKTLVVAPHPDDESLGCGGAIALLRKFNCEVFILTLSDGTLSHPNSKKFPAEKLRDLREKELLNAAKVLGVKSENVTFFRFRDRGVPHAKSENFAQAANRCSEFLRRTNPQTIIVPWRRDPHPDHRAAFALFERAKSEKQKILEYPIWLWELAENADVPQETEVSAFRLDIKSVAEKKQRAIRMHKSQITDLIDDDPEGFRLSEEILANFAADFEIYLEQNR